MWIEGVAGTKQTFNGPITSWNASPLEPVHQYTAVVELVSTGGAHRKVTVTFTTGESVDKIDASFTGMTACPNGQECGSMTLTASRASQFQRARRSSARWRLDGRPKHGVPLLTGDAEYTGYPYGVDHRARTECAAGREELPRRIKHKTFTHYKQRERQ